MKFQMLNEEGNLETFEKLPKSIHDIQPSFYFQHTRNETIEQCAQIADAEADHFARICLDPDAKAEWKDEWIEKGLTANKIAKRIRALASSSAQSSRNITQEQAVISALVEACEIAEETISHVHDDFPECYQKLQDALALANTLKKGEVK